MARRNGNKPPKDAILNSTSSEHFKLNNQRIAEKSKKECEQTDAEKVRNKTHKWVQDGKIIRLLKINPAN
tara:strand:+ start:71 stop:280 length:210 start_codon:yes stop_codon:yes gene_type:complete